MFWAFVGILIGVLIGLSTKFSIPPEFARYTAVAILAMIDSIFGAWRADLVERFSFKIKGANKFSNLLLNRGSDIYDPVVFITGLIFNTALAAAFTYLGDRLGINLYIAVLVVFTWRIFINLGVIRRILFKRYKKKPLLKAKSETHKETLSSGSEN